MTLKQKTITGTIWSFIDSFANQGIQFIVGIILARILSPREFGLIGMLTIFIALSQSFIDSGFTSALIRKQDCTHKDYATVFYFNFVASLIFYLILFFFSGYIAVFFKEPQLELLLQILGIGLILNSFGIIQRTILTKNIDFKLQTRVSVLASILSGVIAIYMAYSGHGVWSLVALTLSRFGIASFLLWLWTKWKPTLTFSVESFKELFSFGSKLLISGLLDTAYRNIYYLVIGKYFSAAQLGYYTRADQFQALPSQQLTGIFGRVSYPILSTIQNDLVKLRSAYIQLIRSTMLITFVLMLGMSAIAQPMILTLIGEKWLPAVIYLQMLCFVGMLYPLHALNLNMLTVQGRSDLFLRLEILKKLMGIPVIIIGIFYGIKIMILGMIINSVVAYFLNSYWSGKLIGYSSFEQIKDIFPSFLLAFVVAICVYIVGTIINLSAPLIFLIQLITGMFLTILLAEIFRLNSYLYLKEIFLNKLGIGNTK